MQHFNQMRVLGVDVEPNLEFPSQCDIEKRTHSVILPDMNQCTNKLYWKLDPVFGDSFYLFKN